MAKRWPARPRRRCSPASLLAPLPACRAEIARDALRPQGRAFGSLKVQGLELRQAELEFYLSRFSRGDAPSIMTLISYIGIIKIKIPEDQLPPNMSWQAGAFYISACLAMVLSMFNLVLTAFALVQGQGLSLRGPPGSVANAISIFKEQWKPVRVVLVLALVCMTLAGLWVSWMKLDPPAADPGCAAGAVPCWLLAAWPALAITALVAAIVVAMLVKIREMQVQLRIPTEELVHGDLMVAGEAERLDLLMEQEGGSRRRGADGRT